MKDFRLLTMALLAAILLFLTAAVTPAQSAAPGLGETREGIIRGIAFDDLNKNGVRDVGEPGVAGTIICEVEMGCDYTEWGEYEWDMLYPGSYQVYVAGMPEGYFVISESPVTVVLPEGFYVAIVNFALSNDPEGLIRAKTFVDLDRDRTRDPLEPGLDGVWICLEGYIPNWCNYTEYGEAEFDLLPPGEYTVRVQAFPKGCHIIQPRRIHISLADGEIQSGIFFGFRQDQRRVKE